MKKSTLTKFLAAALLLQLSAFGLQLFGGEAAVNLLANGLADWTRHKFPANNPRGLTEKSPWSYDAQTGILLCNATKNDHDMLLYKTPQTDGTFSLEYRYVGAPEKNNSGAFIRTTPDAATWVQAQLATSGLGLLFGYEKIEGVEKPKRISAGDRRPDLQKPAGEWNVLELTARGPEITLTVNGQKITTLKDFQTPSGHIGLEAEFYPIEFRNLRYAPKK